MNITKPSFKIVRYTQDMYSAIEDAARLCYQSEPKGNVEESCRFLQTLIKRGHHTPFEFADIEVEFVVDRGVSHELVRHRLCSPMQESTRYCDYSKEKFCNEITVIAPSFFPKGETPREIYLPGDDKEPVALNKFVVWLLAMEEAEWAYFTLLDMGASPQEARTVLPNSLKTSIKLKANVREWWHILSLRCDKSAHPQMREVMLPLLGKFKSRWPVLFRHLKGDE